jgi:hypothetical protein
MLGAGVDGVTICAARTAAAALIKLISFPPTTASPPNCADGSSAAQEDCSPTEHRSGRRRLPSPPPCGVETSEACSWGSGARVTCTGVHGLAGIREHRRLSGDLPAGRDVPIGVQPATQKHLASPFAKISSMESVVPPRSEGRIAIVTNVERGMRWTRRRAGRSALARGRRSRVVLTPRRWRQVGDNASHCTGDSGKKARTLGRARRKPLKPLRREGRTDPPTPVVTSVCFHFLHTDRGCSGHPAFPAPSLEGRVAPSCFRADEFSFLARAHCAARTRRCELLRPR